jgi:hypothetical protein
MKALVGRVAGALAMHVEEIDISGNVQLEALYGLEIPVLTIDGRKAAKYRISEDALLKMLKGRAE